MSIETIENIMCSEYTSSDFRKSKIYPYAQQKGITSLKSYRQFCNEWDKLRFEINYKLEHYHAKPNSKNVLIWDKAKHRVKQK